MTNIAATLEKLVEKQSEMKSTLSKLKEELENMPDTENNATKISNLQQQVEKTEERIKKLDEEISYYRWENAKTGIFSFVIMIIIIIVILIVGDQLGYFSLPQLIASLFETKEKDVNDQIREMMARQKEEFEFGMKNL
ncbi:hypothetical protein FDP41_007940 [Naegleria fowleri]|uniref:V-SNARE coiled-coil homology domain-containing protein n=1 Tax=Naegleria fowleri TaxID=5763 RepID=A0A6A5CFJ3_NAEFO|nr:uncharacterized protein FDP41_007940 [Naegleria fowleri]KAF0984025.1 hypothetical protein FDP41_007940 [Naegleria fowleri]CAG4717687.1 unnamed protein product [Naegleria fowleri]